MAQPCWASHPMWSGGLVGWAGRPSCQEAWGDGFHGPSLSPAQRRDVAGRLMNFIALIKHLDCVKCNGRLLGLIYFVTTAERLNCLS